MFTTVFNLDFMDFFARFYKLSLGGPGCISRLHVTNNGAHSWFVQIQGRRLFFLFSPQDTKHLAEEEGGPVDHLEGYAAAVSSVDIFFPSAKRQGFKDTKPQVWSPSRQSKAVPGGDSAAGRGFGGALRMARFDVKTSKRREVALRRAFGGLRDVGEPKIGAFKPFQATLKPL